MKLFFQGITVVDDECIAQTDKCNFPHTALTLLFTYARKEKYTGAAAVSLYKNVDGLAVWQKDWLLCDFINGVKQ